MIKCFRAEYKHSAEKYILIFWHTSPENRFKESEGNVSFSWANGGMGGEKGESTFFSNRFHSIS
jgi:hypothetical protein